MSAVDTRGGVSRGVCTHQRDGGDRVSAGCATGEGVSCRCRAWRRTIACHCRGMGKQGGHPVHGCAAVGCGQGVSAG